MRIVRFKRRNELLRQERLRRHWRQSDLAEQLETTAVTVRRWESGSCQPSAYFRMKLCTLLGKSAEELGLLLKEKQPLASTGTLTEKPSNVTNAWEIMHDRNLFFTGREELLQFLYENLRQKHIMRLSQSWVINGLGGIGKTQFALEYAYRFRRDYYFVFWTNSSTQEALLSGIQEIAEVLQLPERISQDQNMTIQAIKRWLITHNDWLWILDNVDDITLIQQIVPTEHSGHLILTTRAQSIGTLARRIEMPPMGMAEATLFLLRRAKIVAPHTDLYQIKTDQLAEAESIAIELDFHPLALDQAGSYIEDTGCCFASYLELYRMHSKMFLLRRGYMPSNYPESVTTIYSLTLQKIDQTSPISTDLLRLCAFLRSNPIPEELFLEMDTVPDLIKQGLSIDTLTLDMAMEELRRHSLIHRDPETRQVHIHHLVQTVIKDSMEKEDQRKWAEKAIHATNAIFPKAVETASSYLCQRYLPQAQQCVLLIENYELYFEAATSLLLRTAMYLKAQKLYEQAELLYRLIIRIWERTNPNPVDALLLLSELAAFYQAQGKFEQTEVLYQQASQIQAQPDLDHLMSFSNAERHNNK